MPKTLRLPGVDQSLAAHPGDRRDTMTPLRKAIGQAVPKLAPFLTSGMEPSPLIGYGKYRDRSESAREADGFTIGLVAGKSGYALRLCVGSPGATSSNKVPRSSAT